MRSESTVRIFADCSSLFPLTFQQQEFHISYVGMVFPGANPCKRYMSSSQRRPRLKVIHRGTSSESRTVVGDQLFEIQSPYCHLQKLDPRVDRGRCLILIGCPNTQITLKLIRKPTADNDVMPLIMSEARNGIHGARLLGVLDCVHDGLHLIPKVHRRHISFGFIRRSSRNVVRTGPYKWARRDRLSGNSTILMERLPSGCSVEAVRVNPPWCLRPVPVRRS